MYITIGTLNYKKCIVFILITVVYTLKILLICITNKCKPINSEIYAVHTSTCDNTATRVVEAINIIILSNVSDIIIIYVYDL